jgi:hypothetical protein
MQQVVDFVSAHYMMILGVAYAVISAGVAATKSEEDDAAWLRFCQAISILAPRNVPKVFSLPGKRDAAVALLCFAPLLGGCAGAKVPVEDARAVACIAVERSFVERDDAELRIAITRAVCDELHRRLVGE